MEQVTEIGQMEPEQLVELINTEYKVWANNRQGSAVEQGAAAVLNEALRAAFEKGLRVKVWIEDGVASDPGTYIYNPVLRKHLASTYKPIVLGNSQDSAMGEVLMGKISPYAGQMSLVLSRYPQKFPLPEIVAAFPPSEIVGIEAYIPTPEPTTEE